MFREGSLKKNMYYGHSQTVKTLTPLCSAVMGYNVYSTYKYTLTAPAPAPDVLMHLHS